MSTEPVPKPTLRRLPAYYQLLLRLRERGQVMVSAAQMGEVLGVHHTQVRKDLAFTGSQGRPKVGHRVEDLLASIEQFLDWRQATTAVLVGAGSLGTALLGYEGIARAGVTIVAAFDSDPAKHGRKRHGIPVRPIEDLETFAREREVAIGIITVPAVYAPPIAAAMVKGGIRAIWNFAPIRLDVPGDVIVETTSLAASLAVLSRKLAIQRQLPASEPAAG